MVLGSCRRAKPDSPKLAAALGFDALDVYARRMAGVAPEEWPDALLLLGDQVYADVPTPDEALAGVRRDLRQPPWDEVADFTEYARLYLESWSNEEVRWLLSTVSTAMIFDDHDVRDDWNTSRVWRDRMRSQRWWHQRIRGGLASYWVYQHAGNLGAEQRATDLCWQAVTGADGDAWPVLERIAGVADDDPTSIRWSYYWSLDRVRLVMVDSRAGRMLDEDDRSMLDDDEFEWVEQTVGADTVEIDHVLVGSSLPWLLPSAIHDVQSINEAAATKRGWRGRLAETFRQGADLEHWAAFGTSFVRMTGLLADVGSRPDAPATITFLSGDVHFAYVAQARFPAGRAVTSKVFQAVCSPIRNPLPRAVRVGQRFACSTVADRVGRALARAAKVEKPELTWRVEGGPAFGNEVATLDLDGRSAVLTVEKAVPGPVLAPSFTHVLS